MPVYNGEKYLLESIKHVLKSNLKKFEFIIVNDGSSDNSENIIKSFKDKRIKYFGKINSGISESLNYGLSKCNYNLIARIDCDDLMLSDRLGIQYKYFLSNTIDVLGSNAILFGSNDKNLISTKMPLSHHSIKNKLEWFESPLIHPSVMYKKESVIKAGGYKEKYADDYELWLRMIKNNRFSNLKENLIYLRKHETNFSFIKSEEFIMTKHNSLNNYYGTKQNKNDFLLKKYSFFFQKATNEQSFNLINKILKEIIKRLLVLRIKYNL